MDHIEGQRSGKESRKALNSVIDTAYHKLVMSLFSWMDGLGDKELEKFRFIARLGILVVFSFTIPDSLCCFQKITIIFPLK